mmetsp:Transcript_3042/g.8292  ORF Transcript_3042/g.8292 Transcript_3042/m.8292 type:complete len:423 (-) Transcript_3042:633-1901(-)
MSRPTLTSDPSSSFMSCCIFSTSLSTLDLGPQRDFRLLFFDGSIRNSLVGSSSAAPDVPACAMSMNESMPGGCGSLASTLPWPPAALGSSGFTDPRGARSDLAFCISGFDTSADSPPLSAFSVLLDFFVTLPEISLLFRLFVLRGLTPPSRRLLMLFVLRFRTSDLVSVMTAPSLEDMLSRLVHGGAHSTLPPPSSSLVDGSDGELPSSELEFFFPLCFFFFFADPSPFLLLFMRSRSSVLSLRNTTMTEILSREPRSRASSARYSLTSLRLARRFFFREEFFRSSSPSPAETASSCCFRCSRLMNCASSSWKSYTSSTASSPVTTSHRPSLANMMNSSAAVIWMVVTNGSATIAFCLVSPMERETPYWPLTRQPPPHHTTMPPASLMRCFSASSSGVCFADSATGCESRQRYAAESPTLAA